MNMDFYTAFYDMDENRVFVWMTDGKIVAIDCTKVENAFVDNLYERSELDCLIHNDPMDYAELILNGVYSVAIRPCARRNKATVTEN